MVKSLVFAWVALAECDPSLPKLKWSHPAGATHQIQPICSCARYSRMIQKNDCGIVQHKTGQALTEFGQHNFIVYKLADKIAKCSLLLGGGIVRCLLNSLIGSRFKELRHF